MKYNKLIILVFLLSTFAACKKLDSGLKNPNSVDPSLANVDLLLNSAQLAFTSVYTTASDIGGQLTRQQIMFGPLYSNAYTPTTFDGIWTSAYTGAIVNINTMLPIALQQKKYVQAGIGQVLKAYILGTLVDYFGNVPNSEAVLGQDNLNPKADPGASVYQTVFTLLDSAISNFGKSGAGSSPTNDLFYAGDKVKWATAAKTLKLKFYMQTRLVDAANVTAKVTALETAGDLINATTKDFQFKYSTVNNAPDSRHPHYAANYNNAVTGSNSANDYIGDYFMWAIGIEKSGGGVVTNLDPRRRYYFYRQNTNYANVNPQSSSCSIQPFPGHYTPDMPFCLVGAGYWGRDHGDNSGIPPDGQYRTTWGVYPAAGDYDASQNTSVNNTRGGKGAGIDPIWVSCFTYFIESEAALKLGVAVAGTPRFLLEQGMRASIAKVLAFPATVNVTVASPPTTATIDNYVNTVLARYDAATTDAQRLDVIMKEYYLATWGNGIESYNNYRRTGSPNNMQPVLTTPNPGFFIRSVFYPSVYINRNINAPTQKTPGAAANKVFWDNNPDNFIK
jgi:Starch-binding associating with outer membrane/Susd and RagB outer membrane lipoprotein